MKILKASTVCVLLSAMTGCANTANDSLENTLVNTQSNQIQDGHYRLQSFHKRGSVYGESLSKFCREPEEEQFVAGQEEFWVAAQLFSYADNLVDKTFDDFNKMKLKQPQRRNANSPHYQPDAIQRAYVQLSADFEPNQSYILNRERSGKDISVWVENEQTGEVVSNVAKVRYKKVIGNYRAKHPDLCSDDQTS